MGNLSIRCWAGKNAGAEVASAPALIGFDEFQLAIPWRDALQQSPPPLHQPGAVCCTLGSPVEHFAANGDLSLNCLSHPRGQAQNGSLQLSLSWKRRSLSSSSARTLNRTNCC